MKVEFYAPSITGPEPQLFISASDFMLADKDLNELQNLQFAIKCYYLSFDINIMFGLAEYRVIRDKLNGVRNGAVIFAVEQSPVPIYEYIPAVFASINNKPIKLDLSNDRNRNNAQNMD